MGAISDCCKLCFRLGAGLVAWTCLHSGDGILPKDHTVNYRISRILNAVRTLISPRRHPEQAFELLNMSARYLLPGYAPASPFVAWYRDEGLREHQRRFDDSGQKLHRVFALEQLLQLVRDTEGDTAEIGVLLGSSSAVICQANANSLRKKTHFLFDSFEGLSDPLETDGAYWQPGDLSVSAGNLRLTPDDGTYVVLKGWVPDRFPEVQDRKFSFVHIDVDLYEPTKASLRFFAPRMSVGGIILCDDYGSTRCPGATQACEEWKVETGQTWVALAGGGGFAIIN